MEDKNAKLAKVILGAQIVLVVLVVNALLRGLALSVLWGWFVEPLGVPGINVAEAIGLNLLIGLVTMSISDAQAAAEKKNPFGQAFLISASSCGLALLLGWIVHLFV